MITQKRAAYYSADKTTELAGRSIDTKPTNVANGSEYTEIDTGRVYVFDAENAVWFENKSVGGAGSSDTTGTYNYNQLINKPSINNVILTGEKMPDDLGLLTSTSDTIVELQNKVDVAGDMRKVVYDVNGAVATGGGIAAYINTQLQGKQSKTDSDLDTTSKTVVGAINEIKDAVNAISSVANIMVVDTKPDIPTQNTLYYVGTKSPYQIWLYTTKWYDMGTTEIDLNQYAKLTYVENQLELKQDNLSDTQMNTVNSGITAESFANKADADLTNIPNTVFKQKVVDSGYTVGKIYFASGNTRSAGLTCPAHGMVDGEVLLDLPEGVNKNDYVAQTSIRVRNTTIVFPVTTGTGWVTENDVTKYKVSFTAYNPTDEEIINVYIVAQVMFFEK